MRRLLLILLVAPLTCGGAAYAMRAVTTVGETRFALAVTPSIQTVARGGTVSFGVDVLRADGFTGPVALRVTGLPARVRARWQVASGRWGRVLAGGDRAAKLTLRVPARTRLRTTRVKVLATGDGRTLRRTLLLTVVRPAQRRFSLRVSPARLEVTAGRADHFTVRIARARGFRASVRLRVLGVPRNVGVKLRGAALAVTIASAKSPGHHQLVVGATSGRGRRVLRRYAVVVLSVVAPDTISGTLATPVYPGASVPIDLRMTNAHAFAVRVRSLRVSVEPRTSKPGCRGDADYAVRQYTGAFPLRLRPGTTRMSALGVHAALWPRLAMLDLPRNQDACRGAVLRLNYRMLVTR